MKSPPDWTLRGPGPALIALLIYTVIWTIFAVLSDPGGLHHDMTEAYAWGREFQLGYYKHPPFWAWLAGLWFEVFPRENWAFYLLATLCTGTGVLGVWYLAGLFTKGPFQVASALLILLIPFYAVQGHKFNANLILVPLWPWTVYFFVRSIEKLQMRDAALFGALAAAGLLSKYYTALLLLSCLVASLLHPNRKAYYRSVSPYLAVAVCALLLVPHIWWLSEHSFQTLTYVETRTAFSAETVHTKLAAFIFGCLALCGGVIAVVCGARLWGGRRKIEANQEPIPSNRLWFAMVLGFGPFLLTILSAIFGNVRLSTNFASPIFFLVPLILIQAVRPNPRLMLRAAVSVAVCLTVAALLVSPLVPYFASASKQRRDEMLMPEIANAARMVWRMETGKPLKVVAGSEAYAGGVAFYSGERTSAFIDFDEGRSPWITPAILKRDGFLALCFEDDQDCSVRAKKWGGNALRETSLSIPRRFSKSGSSALVLRILLALPDATALAAAPDAAMR